MKESYVSADQYCTDYPKLKELIPRKYDLAEFQHYMGTESWTHANVIRKLITHGYINIAVAMTKFVVEIEGFDWILDRTDVWFRLPNTEAYMYGLCKLWIIHKPDNPSPAYWLAMNWGNRGYSKKAGRYWRMALRLDPKSEHHKRCKFMIKDKNPDHLIPCGDFICRSDFYDLLSPEIKTVIKTWLLVAQRFKTLGVVVFPKDLRELITIFIVTRKADQDPPKPERLKQPRFPQTISSGN